MSEQMSLLSNNRYSNKEIDQLQPDDHLLEYGDDLREHKEAMLAARSSYHVNELGGLLVETVRNGHASLSCKPELAASFIHPDPQQQHEQHPFLHFRPRVYIVRDLYGGAVDLAITGEQPGMSLLVGVDHETGQLTLGEHHHGFLYDYVQRTFIGTAGTSRTLLNEAGRPGNLPSPYEDTLRRQAIGEILNTQPLAKHLPWPE